MYSKLIETMKKLMPEKKLSRDEALQAIRNAGWEVETVCPHCKIEYADHSPAQCQRSPFPPMMTRV